MMFELDKEQLKSLERALVARFTELEIVYKRNVNSNPAYADLMAQSIASLLSVYRVFFPKSSFFTTSSSLHRYLYGDAGQVELFGG